MEPNIFDDEMAKLRKICFDNNLACVFDISYPPSLTLTISQDATDQQSMLPDEESIADSGAEMLLVIVGGEIQTSSNGRFCIPDAIYRKIGGQFKKAYAAYTRAIHEALALKACQDSRDSLPTFGVLLEQD